jgi:hypothetical protein
MTGLGGTARPNRAPVHLRIFVASPGDVGEERGLALEILDKLPYVAGLRGKATIEVVAWDKPGAGTPMLATMTPQTAIARGLPKPSECDIVVVILWSRIGTPLPAEYQKPDGTAYLSGTEWEYLDALEAAQRDGRPEILVYRRTEEPKVGLSDPQREEKISQWQKVEAFFAAFRNPDGSIRGGVNPYAAPEHFRESLSSHIADVVFRLLEARAPATAAAEPPARADLVAPWKGSPFPGLRTFTPHDAPIFFGRERETGELVRELRDDSVRFIVVVGASGSGKSSLIAAGLLPRLRGNAIEGSKDWLLPRTQPGTESNRPDWIGLRFTPGEFSDNPFQAAAAKLAPIITGPAVSPRQLADALQRDPAHFARCVQEALRSRPDWAEALVFVDQFEELLTVVAEPHRGRFADTLVTAAQAPRLRVIASLRADFYHRCIEELPQLAPLLRQRGASFPLEAPGAHALAEMVAGPAGRAGLTFDSGLPDRILRDAGTSPGVLPLLAFALHELVESSDATGRLTARAYEAFGGVQRAIGQRAESTFTQLSPNVQSLLPDVFRELVDVDAEGTATRRRVLRSQLETTPGAAYLLDAFTDARLLVADRASSDEALVEVAHEALLREWPRLKKWIGEHTDDLRLRRQAQNAASEWSQQQHDPSYLWPNERLVSVHDALGRLGLDRHKLPEPEKAFLRPEAERLLEELKQPATPHYRRAEIGDRLERIGDSRPGVGARPDGAADILWCNIPGGVVSLDGRKGSFAVEPFSMSKYLVTYRQYRAFLEDPQGYPDPRWWTSLSQNPVPGKQYRPVGNCPAETVSWYDAVAYCRWLGAHLANPVRLPTEMEWQQAATGGSADRRYPWGLEWDPQRINSIESRLSRTTAVGMYPDGAAPNEVLDLGGNVWEWCANKYANPLDVNGQGKETRALRGGSWNRSGRRARCLARNDHLGPENRSFDIGFRVVCQPLQRRAE